jgi:hypothetical protein
VPSAFSYILPGLPRRRGDFLVLDPRENIQRNTLNRIFPEKYARRTETAGLLDGFVLAVVVSTQRW